MLRLLKTPKIQMVLALVLIFVTLFIRQPSAEIIFRFLLTLMLVVGADILLLKIRRIEPFFPSAGIVSACIISLLLAPNLPLEELVLTALLVLFSKHFFRIDKRHIFNPAAFGLFFASTFFNHDISWWGVSWQQLNSQNLFLISAFLILLTPGYVSVVKMRRTKIIISFFLTYIALNFFWSKNLAVIDPTVLFFTLVMLPEPMTTPNKPFTQILFGIFVAIESMFFSSPIFSSKELISNLIPDPLIAALLVGNFVFFKFR